MSLDFTSFIVGLIIGAIIPLTTYFFTKKRSFIEEESEIKEQLQQLTQNALLENHKHFQSMAGETFHQYMNQIESSHKHSKESIQQRVEPLESLLKQMDKHLKDANVERTQTHTQLMEQISFMNKLSTEVSEHTRKLTSSLRRSHAAGGWGELHLKRTVETAGMTAYCDFIEQANIKTESTTLRPDMLVRLPNQRVVFVDAKAPLETLNNYIEASSENDIQTYASKLSKTIKDHIKQLSNKKYWSYDNLSPEFVILFLPSEALYAAAMDNDPSLISFATQKQIILASPTTLIGLLLTVHHGWKQERVSTQANQVLVLAKQLVDRSQTLITHLENIKASISKSASVTNQAFRSLNSRFIPKVNELSQIIIPESNIQLSQEPIPESQEALHTDA